MRVLLVRHAIAAKRRDWTQPDTLRPLVAKGLAQADDLVRALRPFDVDRIVTSPYLRCEETVNPLARTLGLPIEVADELGEGREADALGLIGAHGEKSVVLCSHGDVIPRLLGELAGTNAWEAARSFAKGSTWVVELGPPVTTTYLPPRD